MKLRIYTVDGYTDYSNVCFADACENPKGTNCKYLFFVRIMPIARCDYNFFYDWHPASEIVRVEQLELARSKFDKALAHQLDYILDDKFIKIQTQTK